MKIVNAVIDESSDSSFEKGIKELTREIIPPEPKVVQEVVEQEPASPSTPSTPSVVEDSADITTSPDSESHEEKGPSFRIEQNHPPEDIVGNMNELTLRKCTVDNVLLTLCLILIIYHRLNPLKLKKLFRMKVRFKQCTMNCFNFRGMMSGPWYLDQRVNTSSATNGYFAIRMMRKAM